MQCAIGKAAIAGSDRRFEKSERGKYKRHQSQGEMKREKRIDKPLYHVTNLEAPWCRLAARRPWRSRRKVRSWRWSCRRKAQPGWTACVDTYNLLGQKAQGINTALRTAYRFDETSETTDATR